ncbi:MAG TPA: ABC transporter permease [Puia sp.]|jgi:putative ABC transport system permease protein|nr:ABC transporter permease [Puia sp.]
MLRNYIKIAWRNFLKYRTFSIINIIGLSFSVAFCLLLFFYIRKEQSYDTFSENKDRLFRFESTNFWSSPESKPANQLFSFLTKDDKTDNILTTSLIIGRDIQQNFPEVKGIVRFQDQGNGLIKLNKEVYKAGHIVYADDNFFKTFSFPIIKGNKEALKSSIKNVVISENTAKIYFSNSDPIGKTIGLVSDSTSLFTIAAVAENPPDNSSIVYDVVIPLQSDPGYAENIKQGFNQSSHLLFIELKEGVSMASFSDKLNLWAKKYYVEPFVSTYGSFLKDFDFKNYRWHLRPMADCHYNLSGPWGHYTDAKNIYQLACLVIIILLIASLNYVLLVISNASARSQEVGVRKVMGANRKSIIMQFWVETQIIISISVIIGLILTLFLLPLFDNIIGNDLRIDNINWKDIIPAVMILSFSLGILAGYYPALIISKMKPVSILKSFRTFKINPYFSKVLVVLQYTGSVVLMISAFIITRQMRFINNKDLGFDKEQVLIVSNPVWNMDFTKHAREQLGNFARSQPYISYFSGMNGGLNGANNMNGFKLNGEQKWRKQLSVDYDYFEMLGIHFLQGRSFSRTFSTDSSRKKRPAVINESLLTLLGDKAKVGEYCEPIDATIIGVVQDYNFETLSKKIEPEEHVLGLNYESSFMFKIKAGQIPTAISGIGKEWKSFTNYPFEYTFLDDTINKMYESDKRWEKTIQFSCFFAIFIACMGLFGLSAINAINRTKEIGIRKVLGASVRNIAVTLSSGFMKMVIIAIIIATPLSYWIMSKWLDDFAYRIDLSWWMFVVVGAIAFIIALATTSFQTIKAAVVNPVESLRAE